MTKKRIYRCCISFLVICCVLFNFVTVPARAAATAIASGIIALLFSIGMGIVAVDLTMQAVGGYHTSLEKAGIELYQNDADKQSEFLTWIQNLGKDAEDGIIETTDTVRDAIRHWGAGLMTGEGIDVEGETVPDGFALYNDVEFPVLPTSNDAKCPYVIITYAPNSGLYQCHFFSSKPYISGGYVRASGNYTVMHHSVANFGTPDACWTSGSGGVISGACYSVSSFLTIWTNFDLMESSSVVFAASEPVFVDISTVYPSAFVGDIPGKIQSGEADEDQIYVPDRLNITQILTGEVDDLEAVNNVSSQLAAGTLTLEQYLEMTQAKDDTQSGTDVWVPPSDPGIYALDLTSYFPFCIPFDLYDFFSCLAADPVAPVIHWEVALPGGSTMPVDIDLSPFDSVAQLLRRLQLLLFAVGLAIKTRDLIRG